MSPAPSASPRLSTVMLASVVSLRGGSLRPDQQALLKAALERPGAAIAVTGGGEYLGMFDRTELALDAALAFLHAAEAINEQGLAGAYAGRVALEVWPEDSELPVEHIRQVLALAQEHGLLLTASCIPHLPARLRSELQPLGSRQSNPALQGVMELPWRETAATYREATLFVSSRAQPEQHQALRLTRRGASVLVRPEDCPFTVGRDAACALGIGGPNVSRLHGAVLYEAGKFHYRDDSRNGSYLTSGGTEVFVHAERYPLVAEGVISPGSPLIEQTGDVIRYACLAFDPGR